MAEVREERPEGAGGDGDAGGKAASGGVRHDSSTGTGTLGQLWSP
jgi:hypothetical protein